MSPLQQALVFALPGLCVVGLLVMHTKASRYRGQHRPGWLHWWQKYEFALILGVCFLTLVLALWMSGRL